MEEKQIVGLVNKPQFDVDKFQPGTALKVAANNKCTKGELYGFNKNCLVTKATPLSLTLVYIGTSKKGSYDEDDYHTDEISTGATALELEIDDVATGKVTITFIL